MPDVNDYTPYTQTVWHDGDQITTDKMTNIENGIAALSTQIGDALGSSYSSLNDRISNGLLNTDEDILFKRDLRIQKEHPALYFLDGEEGNFLGGIFQSTTNGENRIALAQSYSNKGKELFWLPSPTEHVEDDDDNVDNDNISYTLLTSKNPVTVDQGGTGAQTPLDARVNLGLGTVLTDISTLQNRVNGIAFSELLTVAKTKTLTIQRVDTSKLSAYVVLVGSANDNGKTILLGHFTADGTPTLASLRSASGVTIATPATGKATIKNTLTVDANLYIKILVFYGTTLTFSIA